MDTMQHLKALALDDASAIRAAEFGITKLQARRWLQGEALLARRIRRIRREFRDLRT